MDAVEGGRPAFGPDEEIPWPVGAGWLEFHPKIAAVLRRAVDDAITPEETPSVVFGYTVGDWLARRTNGDPMPTPRGVPLSIGPCVVTADELDHRVRHGPDRRRGVGQGEPERDGARAAPRRRPRLEAGTTGTRRDLRVGPFEIPGFEQRVWPGAEVELEAEGIGILANRLGIAPSNG